MSSIHELLKVVQELLALKDVVKSEIQRPLKQELLSVIYEIKTTNEEVKLDDLLKEYNATDLLDLVKKIRGNAVRK